MLCLTLQSTEGGWRDKVWDSLHTGGRVSSPRALGNASFSDFIVVQLLSRVPLFVTRWTAAHQASLSFTVSQSLLKLMSIEFLMLSSFSDAFSQFSRKPLTHDNWVGLGAKKMGIIRKILNTWHPLKCQDPLDPAVTQAFKEMAVYCVLFIFYSTSHSLLETLKHSPAGKQKQNNKKTKRQGWDEGKKPPPESV